MIWWIGGGMLILALAGFLVELLAAEGTARLAGWEERSPHRGRIRLLWLLLFLPALGVFVWLWVLPRRGEAVEGIQALLSW